MFMRWLFKLWVCLICAAASAVWAQAPDFSAIVIKDAEFSYLSAQGDAACCGRLSALGKVVNTSGEKLEDPNFEARFYDANGQLVDALHEMTFGLALLPGQEVTVRLMGAASHQADRYASVQIGLISGDFVPAVKPRSSGLAWGGWLWSLLASWGPMLLLIGVWIWVLKRSNGINYQKDVLELMKHQNETLARQAAAIEKIARMRDASKP